MSWAVPISLLNAGFHHISFMYMVVILILTKSFRIRCIALKAPYFLMGFLLILILGEFFVNAHVVLVSNLSYRDMRVSGAAHLRSATAFAGLACVTYYVLQRTPVRVLLPSTGPMACEDRSLVKVNLIWVALGNYMNIIPLAAGKVLENYRIILIPPLPGQGIGWGGLIDELAACLWLNLFIRAAFCMAEEPKGRWRGMSAGASIVASAAMAEFLASALDLEALAIPVLAVVNYCMALYYLGLGDRALLRPA